MVLQLVIAYVLASLLNFAWAAAAQSVYKTLLIFPWAMPGYVSILLWKTGMFNSQFGLLNQWLSRLGLEPVRWLSGDGIAFPVLHGGESVAGASFYAHNHRRRSAKRGKKLLRKRAAGRSRMAGTHQIYNDSHDTPDYCTRGHHHHFTTFKQFDVIYLMTRRQAGKPEPTFIRF